MAGRHAGEGRNLAQESRHIWDPCSQLLQIVQPFQYKQQSIYTHITTGDRWWPGETALLGILVSGSGQSNPEIHWRCRAFGASQRDLWESCNACFTKLSTYSVTKSLGGQGNMLSPQLPASPPQVEAPPYRPPKKFSIFCFSHPANIYIQFICKQTLKK